MWGRVKISFKMNASLCNKTPHCCSNWSKCFYNSYAARQVLPGCSYVFPEVPHFRITLNLCISVPQKVSELKAGGGGWLRSLRVNWLPPAGDWERYRLLLWNRSALLLNTTLERDTTEYLIHDLGLIPGRQYGVDVVVESGDLQSKTSCTGRTGQHARPGSVKVQNGQLGSVDNEKQKILGNPQRNFTINTVKRAPF